MKSEVRAVRPPGTPAPDAFQAFFDALDEPAALCDAALRVAAVNPALRRFCAERGITVEVVEQALADATAPEDGHSHELDVVLQDLANPT